MAIVVTLVAIVTIAGLEVYAISKGIDGKALAIALAAIALLAPSPLFQIVWGQWRISKGGDSPRDTVAANSRSNSPQAPQP